MIGICRDGPRKLTPTPALTDNSCDRPAMTSQRQYHPVASTAPPRTLTTAWFHHCPVVATAIHHQHSRQNPICLGSATRPPSKNKTIEPAAALPRTTTTRASTFNQGVRRRNGYSDYQLDCSKRSSSVSLYSNQPLSTNRRTSVASVSRTVHTVQVIRQHGIAHTDKRLYANTLNDSVA